MKKRFPKQTATWMRYAGLGVDFSAAVAGLTLIGYWMDRHWGWGHKATLTGAALGLIGGMYNLIRGSLAAFAELEAEERAEKPDDEDS